MCLYTKPKATIKTANADISVVKILMPIISFGSSQEEVFMSPFKHFLYFPGKIYEPVKLKVEKDKRHRRVYEGFHAYTTQKAALKNLGYDEVCVNMIVPKGAKYIYGDNSDIVSSHIQFPKSGE